MRSSRLAMLRDAIPHPHSIPHLFGGLRAGARVQRARITCLGDLVVSGGDVRPFHPQGTGRAIGAPHARHWARVHFAFVYRDRLRSIVLKCRSSTFFVEHFWGGTRRCYINARTKESFSDLFFLSSRSRSVS